MGTGQFEELDAGYSNKLPFIFISFIILSMRSNYVNVKIFVDMAGCG